jgi:hypothetical protein
MTTWLQVLGKGEVIHFDVFICLRLFVFLFEEHWPETIGSGLRVGQVGVLCTVCVLYWFGWTVLGMHALLAFSTHSGVIGYAYPSIGQ